MKWPLRWPRKRLHKLIDRASAKEDRDWARGQADSADRETIPGLEYTERREGWWLLRKHATRGQITPEQLKQMKREDLEYLAGMTNVNPIRLRQYEADPNDKTAATLLEEIKVVENAVRATRELERRSRVSIQLLVGGIAATAAIVAAMIERQAWPFVDGRGWPW